MFDGMLITRLHFSLGTLCPASDHRYVERGSPGFFTTLSMCVCLHWLTLKLAEEIEISFSKGPHSITLKIE